MKKTMLMLFSTFLFVALVALIPGSIASAKLASPEQPTAPFSAQQEDIDKLIEDILLELNQAKGMTTDSEVIEAIDAIIDMVRKLGWLEFTNQEDDALRLKYTIAEQLEKLINELPLASAGMTTALAAMPESNPLYAELVRVRAKIDRLIELETPPLEITPLEPPTISRVPETERLIVYSAKFLCGPSFGKEGVQRGSYSTAINVHNPHNGNVILYKKAVIANREDEPRGRISNLHRVVLGPDEAIEIDCIDIYSLLGPEPEETDESTTSLQPTTGLTTPSIQTSSITPVSTLIRFIKGFVVVYASAPLDVVAVYTASTPVGFSLDVEYLSPSTAATVPVNPPPEEERCPLGCRCLTKAEAEEMGLTAPCNGEMIICEYDDQQRPLRYCFGKPTEQVPCPQGCACLAKTVADEMGYSLCDGRETHCGTDVSGVDMYCYERPTQVECPQGCECLSMTPAEAREQGLIQCLDVSCGTDAAGNLMYCYRRATQVECPQGCECLSLTPAQAKEEGLIQCLDVSCGTDSAGRAMYCYEKATEDTACPRGCECLSELEARRLGYSLCNGQYTPCAYEPGAPQRWCYEPAVAMRITIEPTQDSNLIGTEHAVTVVVYDKYGNPLPSAKVTFAVTGVHNLGPVQLTTNTSGKAVFEYTGKTTGNDTIVATVDGLQATAFKTWYRRAQ